MRFYFENAKISKNKLFFYGCKLKFEFFFQERSKNLRYVAALRTTHIEFIN